MRRKMIIDTDCGADDGIAMLCALHSDAVDVEAITCTWGNVGVDQAVCNAIRLLEAVGASVPVYAGATEPLLAKKETRGWGGHGTDGFGDATWAETRQKQEEVSAVVALVNLLGAEKEPGEVWQLVALGPLTNIALALRICPHLLKDLGDDEYPGLVVMGGALQAKGNSGLSSEYNFHCDPEAALVVMQCAGRAVPFDTPPVTMVAWEVTLACPMLWDEFDQLLGRVGGRPPAVTPPEAEESVGECERRRAMQAVVYKILAKLEQFTRPTNDGLADVGEDERTQGATCVLPDAVAMVAALSPAVFIKNSMDTYATIETSSRSSRGACVVDWYGTLRSRNKNGRWLNTRLVLETRTSAFLDHIFRIVDRPRDYVSERLRGSREDRDSGGQGGPAGTETSMHALGRTFRLLACLRLAAGLGVWLVDDRLVSVYANGKCLFSCAAAADASCPCVPVCEGPYTARCKASVKEYCCKTVLPGIDQKVCETAGNWDVECLPWPVEASEYKGTVATGSAERYAVDVVGASSEDDAVGGVAFILGTADSTVSVCTSDQWHLDAADMRSWIPGMERSADEHASGGPTIIIAIEPTLAVSEIEIHETGSKGHVQRVSLLSSPLDPATADGPKQRADYFKKYTVYRPEPPLETHGATALPKGSTYHGRVNRTVDGHECLSWGHTFYDHPYRPYEWDDATLYFFPYETTSELTEVSSRKGDGVGHHNYCRNPDEDPEGAWCFYWDPALGLPPAFPHSPWMHTWPYKYGEYEDEDEFDDYYARHAQTAAVDCYSMDVGECLYAYYVQGCVGQPFVAGIDCSQALTCTEEVAGYCHTAGGAGPDPYETFSPDSSAGGGGDGGGTGPPPSAESCEGDDVQRLQAFTRGQVSACADLPAYLERQKGGADPKSRLEAIDGACRQHRDMCCVYCLQFGYGSDQAPPKQYLEDTHPSALSAAGALVWPLLKGYCIIPEETPCSESPLTVTVPRIAGAQVITAIEIELADVENAYAAIDAVEARGTPPLSCYDDDLNGHWQEPLCVTCAVSEEVAWKGPTCTDRDCGGAPCLYGFCLPETGACRCYGGYGGSSCQRQCPLNATAFYHVDTVTPRTLRVNASSGVSERPDQLAYLFPHAICSGNGRCNDGIAGDASCACDSGFAGHACHLQCPGRVLQDGVVAYCSGRGACVDGAAGNASCECFGAYYGEDCSKVECDRIPCESGVCLNPVTEQECVGDTKGCYCACFGKESYAAAAVYATDDDGTKGYWDGASCDVCQQGWTGAQCTERVRTLKVFTGQVTSESDITRNGPLYVEPCSNLTLELNLVSGESATLTAESYDGFSWFCEASVEDFTPTSACDLDADVTLTYQSKVACGECRLKAPCGLPFDTEHTFCAWDREVIGGECQCKTPFLCEEGSCVTGCGEARSALDDPPCGNHTDDPMTLGTCECRYGFECESRTCTTTIINQCGITLHPEYQTCSPDLVVSNATCSCPSGQTCVSGFCHTRCDAPDDGDKPCVPFAEHDYASSPAFCRCVEGHRCEATGAACLQQVPCGTKIPPGPSLLECADNSTLAADGHCRCVVNGTICTEGTCATPCGTEALPGTKCIDGADIVGGVCECGGSTYCALYTGGRCAPTTVSECGVRIEVGPQACNASLELYGEHCVCPTPQLCENGVCFTPCDFQTNPCGFGETCASNGKCVPLVVTECGVYKDAAQTCSTAAGLSDGGTQCDCASEYNAGSPSVCVEKKCYSVCGCTGCGTTNFGCVPFATGLPSGGCPCSEALTCFNSKCVYPDTDAPPTSSPPTGVPPTVSPPTIAPTLPPLTAAPPTNAPPTDPPPTPVPASCGDDPSGWLLLHTGLSCAGLEVLSETSALADFCAYDLANVYDEMPSGEYRAASVCQGTCDCCTCDEPPYYDACGAALQVNHSCSLNASAAAVGETCLCGSPTICDGGKCRLMCGQERAERDPKCVSHVDDASVVGGACTCSASQGFSCEDGLCGGGRAACGSAEAEVGCTAGAVGVHGVCTCMEGTLCAADGTCGTKCNVLRSNETMPSCVDNTILDEPWEGHCVCSRLYTCSTTGACELRSTTSDTWSAYRQGLSNFSPGCPQTVAPTASSCADCGYVFIPATSACTACLPSDNSEYLSPDTFKYYEPAAEWCPGLCHASEIATRAVVSPPFAESTAAFTGQSRTAWVKWGTDRWYQLFRPADQGCLSRVNLLVGITCVGVESSPAELNENPRKLCASCPKLRAAVLLRENDCQGQILAVGRLNAWEQRFESARWLQFRFDGAPVVNEGDAYCLELQSYGSCSIVNWLMAPISGQGSIAEVDGGDYSTDAPNPRNTAGGPNVTAGGYDATHGVWVANSTFNHVFAAVVNPNYIPAPLHRTACSRGYTCDESAALRSGLVNHGFQPSVEACFAYALHRGAPYVNYHVGTRNCTTLAACLKIAVPTGYSGGLDVSGEYLACDVPGSCRVRGDCEAVKYNTTWTTECEAGDASKGPCRLCGMEPGGLGDPTRCYECKEGFEVDVTDPDACTGVCVVNGTASSGGACVPRCDCGGENAYGWCGSNPAGAVYCSEGGVLDRDTGLCNCAASLWCDVREGSDRRCLDGAVYSLPTGWCNQDVSEQNTCIDPNASPSSGTCECSSDYNCDQDVGTCAGRFVPCGEYVGEYGYCRIPGYPGATKYCQCPTGFMCTYDSTLGENACLMFDGCGGCGQPPCDEADLSTVKEAALLVRQFRPVKRGAQALRAGAARSFPRGGVSSAPGSRRSLLQSDASSEADDAKTYPTYEEVYNEPTTKFCYGPLQVLHWDFAGTGLCQCRSDNKYQCCNATSDGIIGDASCSSSMYGRCMKEMTDVRGGCGEPPDATYGCRDNASVVLEETLGSLKEMCRCRPGYVCSSLYRVCGEVPKGLDFVQPAACDDQDAGGGCMMNAFANFMNICRCKTTDSETWACQSTGRCRREVTSACSTAKEAQSNYGDCVCDADLYNGYWNGTVCDTCLSGFFGDTCALTCNTTVLSEVRSDVVVLPEYLFGSFTLDWTSAGYCECPTSYGGYSLGFTGDLCNECNPANGRFGDNCSASLPTTPMIFTEELEPYEPFSLGPFKVSSYSVATVTFTVPAGNTIEALSTVLFIVTPTFRDVQSYFDLDDAEAASSAGSRHLLQMRTGGATIARFETEAPFVDETLNDLVVDCTAELAWTPGWTSSACSVSIPRSSGYLSVLVVSKLSVTLTIATRLATDCCNGHGYCQEEDSECTCVSDPQLGYWSTSSQCATCYKGYDGRQCNVFTSEFDKGMTAPVGGAIPEVVLGARSFYAVDVTVTTPFRISLQGAGDCDLATSMRNACGEGWTLHKNECYRLHSDCAATYDDAKEVCEELGGSLARMKNDDAFLHFVSSLISELETSDECPHGDKVWTDIVRQKEFNCGALSREAVCTQASACIWNTSLASCVNDPASSCFINEEAPGFDPPFNIVSEAQCNAKGESFTSGGQTRSKNCFWNRFEKLPSHTIQGTEHNFAPGLCEPQYGFENEGFDVAAAELALRLLVTARVTHDGCIPDAYLAGGDLCGVSPDQTTKQWTTGHPCLKNYAYQQSEECGANATSRFKSNLCTTSSLPSMSCFNGQDAHASHPGYPWYLSPQAAEACYLCEPTVFNDQERRFSRATMWDPSESDDVRGCVVITRDDDTADEDDVYNLVAFPAFCYDVWEDGQTIYASFDDDETISWKRQNAHIYTATPLCTKPRPTAVSEVEDSVLQPISDIEDLFTAPDCYNPQVFPDTSDTCEGVVPTGVDYIAMRVVCLEKRSSYNLSIDFVLKGHYYRGSDPPCVNDDAEGHWMGTFCSECMPRYSGADCLTHHPCSETPGECGDHGTCSASGYCACEAEYFGMYCQEHCGASTCLNGGVCNPEYQTCDANSTGASSCGSFADSSLCTCPTGFSGQRCENCTEGYWGSGCSAACACNDQPCEEASGDCLCYMDAYLGFFAGDSCSVCSEGYYGGDCLTYCDAAASCSGHGACSSAGECACDADYYGYNCAVKCTLAACSNHGTCDASTGACVCHTSYGKGFWGGSATCSACTTGYYGTNCGQDCQCALKGTCDPASGACSCYDDDVRGHWTGDTCTSCLDGYTGENCDVLVVSSQNLLSRFAKLKVRADDRSEKTYDNARGASVLFNVSTDPTYTFLMACAGADVALFQRKKRDPKTVAWEYVGTCNLARVVGFGEDIVGAVMLKEAVYVGLQGASQSAVVPISHADFTLGAAVGDQCPNVTTETSITLEATLQALAADDAYDSIYAASLSDGAPTLSRLAHTGAGGELEASISLQLSSLSSVTGLTMVSRNTSTDTQLDAPYLMVLGTDVQAKPQVLKVFVPAQYSTGPSLSEPSVERTLRPVYQFQPGFCKVLACELFYHATELRGWLHIAVQTYNKQTATRSASIGRLSLERLKDSTASSYVSLPETWTDDEQDIGFLVLDADFTLLPSQIRKPSAFTYSATAQAAGVETPSPGASWTTDAPPTAAPVQSTAYRACLGKLCGDRCLACEPGSKVCVETREDKYCSSSGVCLPRAPAICLNSRPSYLYVGLRTKSPSTIYKILVSELDNTLSLQTPTLQLNYENIESNYHVAVSAAVDQQLRVLYVPCKLSRFQVSVMNLYDIDSVSPSVVDGTGGTLVTVMGDGFPIGLNRSDKSLTVACKWGENVNLGTVLSPAATVIDAQTVVCRAPKVARFDSCDDVSLEVSVENTARFSSNGVSVRHIATAIIEELLQTSGILDSQVPITVVGAGFLNTPYLTCKINNELTSATFVTSSRVLCLHPVTTVPAVTTVEVTLDGSKFTDSRASYAIIGPPYQLNWTFSADATLARSTVYTFPSDEVNLLQTLEASLLDSAGTPVDTYDAPLTEANVTVHCVGPEPARTLPCVSGKCGVLRGAHVVPISEGKVSFAGLYLEHPGTGVYTVYLDVTWPGCSPPDSTTAPEEACVARFSAAPGAAARPIATVSLSFTVTARASKLEFLRTPPLYTTNKAVLPVQPVLVFRDVSDNIATTHTGKVYVTITPDDGQVGLTGSSGDRNTVEYIDGVVTFKKLRVTNGVEGKKYVIHVTPEISGSIAPAASEPLYIAGCSASNDAVSGISPDNGLLGAQLVTVKGWGFLAAEAEHMRCRFGGDTPQPATFVDTCTILCPLMPKKAPDSQRLAVTLDATGVWVDGGFNYSYTDVIDAMTYEVVGGKLQYASAQKVRLNDLTLTLRDRAGNWLRNWDTEERRVYLKTRLAVAKGAVEAVSTAGKIDFTGVTVAAPKEGSYTVLLTTDPAAATPDSLLPDGGDGIGDAVATETEVAADGGATVTLGSDDAVLAFARVAGVSVAGGYFTPRSLQFADESLPAGVTANVLHDYFAVPSDPASAAADACAALCEKVSAAPCLGFVVEGGAQHLCYLLASLTAASRTPAGEEVAVYVRRTVLDTYIGLFDAVAGEDDLLQARLNPCSPRTCGAPDRERGLVTCRYSLAADGRGSPAQQATQTSSFSPSRTLTSLFANETAEGIATLTLADAEAASNFSAEVIAAAYEAWAKTPNSEVEGCVSSAVQACPAMAPARPHPEYSFSVAFVVTVTEGTPHHMAFVEGTSGLPPYSGFTTNRAAMDIQPGVLIVDIVGNEVNSFDGAPSVIVDVKPYCVRDPARQTLDDFRHPEGAAKPEHAGCLVFLTDDDLAGGVTAYGSTYGPSCHGTAPANGEAEFEKTCERVRGSDAWVSNGRALFTELHFRGCASDAGLACARDVRYKMHFTLVGAGVSVPTLVSDSLYTANCPQSSAPLSSIIPAWAKIVTGATVVLKGWDFQPTRSLAVTLGGIRLVSEVVDTCTAFVVIPAAASTHRRAEALSEDHRSSKHEKSRHNRTQSKPGHASFSRIWTLLDEDWGSDDIDIDIDPQDTQRRGGRRSAEDTQRRGGRRSAEAMALFEQPASSTLAVVDEDNPDFESEALAFQIKSSLPERVGLATEYAMNGSIASHRVACSGDDTSTSAYPRICFRTSRAVAIGELPIVLKDGAGGDLYAVGTHGDNGENYGFFEDVVDPADPAGAKVWGREYPGSMDQARDVFVAVEVYPPDVLSPPLKINARGSVCNMTESGGEGFTTDGLLSIVDAMLFLPTHGEYTFKFIPTGTNAKGEDLAEGGVRIVIYKGSAVEFAFSNLEELILETDGVSAMSPAPKLNLLDVAGNTLFNADLPSADRGLEVIAIVTVERILTAPPASWTGWAADDEVPVATDVHISRVMSYLRWRAKVDKNGDFHPLGVPLSAEPLYSFNKYELGGETYDEAVRAVKVALTGEVATLQMWHRGPYLSKTSAPVSIGVEFKDFKVQGLWHGLVYNVSYGFSSTSYHSLGQLSHGMTAAGCSEGQFAVNFSSSCQPCPAGATCDRTQWLRAQAGYWRHGQSDVQFYECKASSCKGGYWAGDRSCEKGSKGPLCSVCDDGYGKSGDVCQSCPSRALNIFTVSIVALGVVLVIYIMVKTNLTNGAKGKSMLSIVIKLLMNYLQTASLMRSFLLKVRGVVNDMLDVQEKASGPSTQFISFSCLADINQYGVFAMWMALPAVLFAIPGLIAGFLYASRKQHSVGLMSRLVHTRDRRYSLGVTAETEEEKIAVLHAVNDGKPVPKSKAANGDKDASGRVLTGSDANSQAKSRVSSISDELVCDPTTANDIIGEDQPIAAVLQSAAKADVKANELDAVRQLYLDEAVRLRADGHLSKETARGIAQLLRAGGAGGCASARQLLKTAAEAEKEAVLAALETAWVEKLSKTRGKAYWRHRITGESKWTKPDEVTEAEAKADAWRAAALEREEAHEAVLLRARQMDDGYTLIVDRADPSAAAATTLPPAEAKAMLASIAARRRWERIRRLVEQAVEERRQKRVAN
ncbi:putative uridine nucleosidase 2, partial [Diplonema papillatum]